MKHLLSLFYCKSITVQRLVILFALLVTVILTSVGCNNQGIIEPIPEDLQQDNTSSDFNNAEGFLNTYSEDELINIGIKFHYIRYGTEELSYDSITSANQIPQTAMFLFFTCTNPSIESYFDTKDKNYHFPLPDIQEYIDKYFDGYTCILSEMVLSDDFYSAEREEITVSALSSPSTPNLEVVYTEVLDPDVAQITFDVYDLDGTVIINKLILSLQITNDGYKFFSSKIS